MNKEERLLCNLVQYMQYLEDYKKSYKWNYGYFRKLKKLLKAFSKEYTKNRWGWY